MKVFWALVRNDSKFEKGDPRRGSSLNILSFIIVYTLGISGFLWADGQGFFNVGFIMWCFLISTPFGNSIYLLNKEWQAETTGWWLTLPYSRSLLLSAKCVASFLHVLMGYAFIFAYTLIMALISNSFQPVFLAHPQLIDILQGCAIDLSWLLILSPFSILLGALIVIIIRSHWVDSTSLSWVGLGLLANLYVAKALGILPQGVPSVRPDQGYFLSVNGSDFFTPLFVSLAVSALLFAFSVYVLKWHVEV